MLGECSDIGRQIIFDAADVALNPMQSGSGTNLKMLDYFAAGLPVVTTAIGAIWQHFPKRSPRLSINQRPTDALSANARVLVDDHFNWERIGSTLLAAVLSDR